MIEYDETLVASISRSLDLRRPNMEALDAIAKALATAPIGGELIADLATGVGKTYIAGALLDYLFESGVRNVVVVTPGSTIQRKTINNFTPGHNKFVRGLRSNPVLITLDDLETGSVATALEDESKLKVFVFTVQSLLSPNTQGARRAHRAHESMGIAVYDYLSQQDDVIVIADEHHIYYSGNAKKFQSAIDDLNPQAMIGLTATPQNPDSPNIVYRYPLAEAIADGFVKVPVLVARQDGAKDLRTQMADGVALIAAKAEVMRAYCASTKQKPVNPILFVVSQTIDQANEIRDMLASPEYLDGSEKVLLITSEEPDATLQQLETLEDDESPVRAVVSVSMLKEGWDVKNIYCIAAIRAMESQLLTEQILGRGLRLPFGRRTGVPMLDTVEVLSHHKFNDLLREAQVLLEQTLGQRAEQAAAFVNPTPGVQTAGETLSASTFVDIASVSGVDQVNVMIPNRPEPRWDDSDSLFSEPESNPGMSFATLDSVLHQAEQARETLTTTLQPQSPGGLRVPLFIPKVTTRYVTENFSLANLSAVEVESLGRTFADDDGEILIRKALDAVRDAAGEARMSIHDIEGAVAASQVLIEFSTIETDLASRLLRSSSVAATLTEANAATDVARAFLRGAQVTEGTPWRKAHGELATARLVEWIRERQRSRPEQRVTEVHQVRWPEPEERIELQSPQDRQLVTSSREFTRLYPYRGWAKSVYEVNSFDAYSTEFRLASLFETSANVKAWVRVDQTVPLRISYEWGSGQREYMPDFIVIDDAGVQWIVEGKADSEMTDENVLAKRDAARAWVQTVNAEPSVSQRWGYILASESIISASGNWTAIKAGGQTFQ